MTFLSSSSYWPRVKHYLSLAAIVVVIPYLVLMALAFGVDAWSDSRPLPRPAVVSPRVDVLPAEVTPPPTLHASTPSSVSARLVEAERLARAMTDFLVSQGGSTEEAERRNVLGLAQLLVNVVDERYRESNWIPISRAKAPAFLAAVSYHEVSWRWVGAPAGLLDERCAFQLGSAAIRHSGLTKAIVDSDPYFCVQSALNWMMYCESKCGRQTLDEYAFGAYATRGICGGAPDVVDDRYSTARWLLAKMETYR